MHVVLFHSVRMICTNDSKCSPLELAAVGSTAGDMGGSADV